MAKRTQRAIVDAFVALLKDRPMEKITVMDVCEASGVSRSTFYYHYHDMYQLLDSLFSADVDTFLADNFTLENWYESLERAARFAVQNRTAIQHICSGLRHDALASHLFQVMGRVVGSLVRCVADRRGNVSEVDIEMVTALLSSQMVGMTFNWMRHGFDEKSLKKLPRVKVLMEGSIDAAFDKLAA